MRVQLLQSSSSARQQQGRMAPPALCIILGTVYIISECGGGGQVSGYTTSGQVQVQVGRG